MTRDELNKLLCAVITTLDEMKNANESTLYLGIGADIEKWNAVKSVLIQGKLAVFQGFTCFITPAGSAMAAKINAFMQH